MKNRGLGFKAGDASPSGCRIHIDIESRGLLMGDHGAAEYLLTEGIKNSIIGQGVTSTLFGALGAYVYSKHSGTLSCTGPINRTYDGKLSLTGDVPPGCNKVVHFGGLPTVLSTTQAAWVWGLCFAFLCVMARGLYLLFKSVEASNRPHG
ncbi:MAG TPA: hypothetical protein VM093_02155 [Aeromicrobium sp.]|nr:hypothetical protein [Aeromicrobium sp.]